MKTNQFFLSLLAFTIFITICFTATATDKIVSITGDATHSGTYVYQGTHTSTSGCGTSRTYKYYKLSGTNYYLYADYDEMGCTDDWFGWYICNGLIARPGQAPGHEFIYNGYMSDYSLVPDNPGVCNAWRNLAGGIVTSNFSIIDAASGVAPTVSTLEASLVTTTSGTIGGNVLADGGATVTARGLVFSPSSNTNPIIGGTNVTQYPEGTGTGSYTQLVSSLTAGATYYYQAYGTNSYGTNYGGVKSFTTPTTSQPNKLVSGITTPSAANGVYVWIGNYYGKPAWKHQTLNYWVYYSRLGTNNLTTYNWYIDGQLRDEHGTGDYSFYHSDVATCPASGWASGSGNGTGTGVPAITDYPNISFTNGTSFSPANPLANTTNNPIGRFYLSGELAGASLTAVTINAAGTRSGVSNLKLWSSASATFSTGSAIQLNSQSDGSTVTFPGISSSISTSGTYYFVTTDLSATASGSFTLTIGSQANLTISGGAIASSFSNAALTSGAITIISFPTISTAAASSIATTSATLGGNVTADGGATISDRGIVYSTTDATPTIAEGGTKVAIGSGTGPFSQPVGSLAQGATYYFNAYAINSAGTSYGTASSFTTLKVPTVTTQAVSAVGTTTATGNGTITDLGNPGSTTAYGICWKTSTGPTISDSHTDGGVKSTTGTFTGSMTGLTAGATYYVRAYATNAGGTSYGGEVTFTTYATASTWTGTGNWSTAGNWSAGIPGSTTEATIQSGVVSVDGNFATKNLILSATGALTIPTGNTLTVNGDLDLESDNNGTGSLINNGTLTVSGIITTQRYMTGGKWHIVSPTAAGGSISTFIQAPGNAISSKDVSGTLNYGMMDYNETTNTWKNYFTTATGGNLIVGTGYSVRRSADGIVAFTGTLTSGTITVPLTKGGEGWNCVGNPYPSAINMNTAAGTNNFLKTNASDASNLDASYACIYVWDQDVAAYKILGNSSYSGRDLGQNVFASGQGFFVKANNSSSSIQFTAAMQVHQPTTALKSASVSWPGFELTATTDQAKASTIVAFNNKMTNGLDVTYDAGLLRGSSGLELYSRLVTDNGVDFAIQCLPESYPSLVIPLGLDCKTGGEVTFSAETVELPAACSVILEDKTTKTFTSLAGGATYKATVSAGATGTGRFYIHTNDVISGVSDLPSAATFSLKVYPATGEIIIEGEVSNQAKASLFDLNGKKLGAYALQRQNRNTISVTGVVPGVYLLSVTDSGKRFTTKIVID